MGRLLSVDNKGTSSVPNVVLSYAYDAKGNIISVNDTINGQIGGITAYNYDVLDRVTKITQTGDGVQDKRVDFTYDAIGQYQSINRYGDFNGTELVTGSNYVYDSLNRLKNLTHSNTSSTVAFYDFVYDAASRITQISDVDGATDYTYDETNQLTGADRSNVNNPDENYSYDANGNRTNSGYVTGVNNRLLSDGTYNYEYDKEGNLIRKIEISTGNVRQFEWDYRNRLVAVVDEDNSANVIQEVSFIYDAMNRRLAKDVNGIIRHFVYDRDNVILEFVDTDGIAGVNQPVLDKRYLHGTRVDQVLAQEDGNGNVIWHLSDHLGTIRDLVDNNGVLVNHLIYDSFGNVVSQMNSEVENRYLFTGREWDSEIGLYYYRARYYAAQIGRFIEEDPIGFEAKDGNLYRYVANTPVNTVDPIGLYGFVVSQSRLITYEDNGNKVTFNIQDVIDANQKNPNVHIKFDNTLAVIAYLPVDTGERIQQDPPSMKLIWDVRGHIVGKQLGGDGSRNNSFAQNGLVNNSWWKAYENHVRRTLDSQNLDPTCPPVLLAYSVGLSYLPRDPFFPLRPGFVTALATFSDGRIISGGAPNP